LWTVARFAGGALVLAGSCWSNTFAEEGARDPTSRGFSYRAVAVGGAGSMVRLKRELGDSAFFHTLKVNRVDFAHAARLDTLVVPPKGVALLDLSPFPPSLSGVDSLPKLLLISLRGQAFGAYAGGRLVRWGPICSGGRRSPTRPGLHFANWKDREHVSSVDSSWVMPWTVNIDDQVGTALHQYSLPGRPVSHCCIRLLAEDARWVYEWIEVRSRSPGVRRGTPIVLFGTYDFGSRPPWATLPAHPGATTLGAEELAEALDLLQRGLP
jgi:L,D-transpeptidase catalytic domain